MNIKEFFRQEDIQEALSNNDLDYVYGENRDEPQIITKFLLSAGIDPIDYITAIFEGMYENVSILSVSIPQIITHIERYGFAWCGDLVEINIPDTVVWIGKGAFEYCIGLENIVLPRGIDTIQEGTFRCCYNLKEVTISPGVTRIEEDAFRECKNLKKLVIPNTLKEISYDAFYLTNNYIKVVYDGVEYDTLQDFERAFIKNGGKVYE